MPPSKPPQPNPPPPPQLLPPGYKIIDILGEGASGKVYKVSAAGGFESAMKVVGGSGSVKESRSLDLIRGIKNHPCLLKYYSVWLRTSDGRFLESDAGLSDADLRTMDILIFMEIADKSLGDRLNECRRAAIPKFLPTPAQGTDTVAFVPDGGQSPDQAVGIPVDELLRYMRDTARGLDHLHAEIHVRAGKNFRLIHRDIKPANLLIFTDAVKIADYGIARAETRGMMATGSICLTTAYAPPEMYRNKPVPASDQYCLAISYYELRTGKFPFDGDPQEAHLEGELDFKLVSAAEQEVLHHATDSMPNLRYPSCMAFVDELWKVADRPAAPTGPAPAPAAPLTDYPAPRAPAAPGPGTRVKGFSHTLISLPPLTDEGAAPAPPARRQRPDPDALPRVAGTLMPGADLGTDARADTTAGPRTKTGSGSHRNINLPPAKPGSRGEFQLPPEELPDEAEELEDSASPDPWGQPAATPAKWTSSTPPVPTARRLPAGTQTRPGPQWAPPTPERAGGGRKMILAGVAVLVLAGAAAGIWFATRPSPPSPFAAPLAAARGEFAAGKLDIGLGALAVLQAQSLPDDTDKTVKALKAAWEKAKADALKGEKSPDAVGDDDRARFAALRAAPAPDGLDDKADGVDLRAYYAALSEKFPPIDYDKMLDPARTDFRYDKFDDGLKKLKEVTAKKIPPATRGVVEALEKEWRKAQADALVAEPANEDRWEYERRAAAPAPDGRLNDATDGQSLRDFYKKRNEKFPPPLDFTRLLANARTALRADTPDAGVTALAALLAKTPPPPTDIQQTAAALKKAWETAQADGRKTEATATEADRERFKEQAAKAAVGSGSDDPADNAALRAYYRKLSDILPPTDYVKLLADARAAFAVPNLDAGIKKLETLLDKNRAVPPDVKKAAEAVKAAWDRAKKDDEAKTPTEEDTLRFAKLVTARVEDGLLDDKTDGDALRAYYGKVSKKYPPPDYTKLLDAPRDALKIGKFDEGLKGIDAVLAKPTAPASVKKTATALKTAWAQVKTDAKEPTATAAYPERAKFKELAAKKPFAPDLEDSTDGEALRGSYAKLVERFPVTDHAAALAAARKAFQAEKFDDGLKVLAAIPKESVPPAAQKEADALREAWKDAAADAKIADDKAATDAHRARFKKLATVPPVGLDEKTDGAALQAIYKPLAKRFPVIVPLTVKELLATARAALAAKKYDAGLADLTAAVAHADITPAVARSAKALLKAWGEVKTLQKKPGDAVGPADFDKACTGVATDPVGVADDDDKAAIKDAYRNLVSDLAQAFAEKPDPKAADWAKAASWVELHDALAKGDTAAPWPALLRVECGLTAKALGGKVEVAALPAAPAKPDDDPTGLKAYRAFVTAAKAAGDAKGGAGAVNDLLAAVGRNEVKALLEAAPSRTRLVARELVAAADGLRPAGAALDQPFGDAAKTELARKWLAAALGLLKGDAAAVVQPVRVGLLQAAAFPTPDPDLATTALGEVAYADLDAVLADRADASKSAADRDALTGFRLAFARTRSPKDKAEIAAAIKAYDDIAKDLLSTKAKAEAVPAVELMKSYLLDPAFAAAVKDVLPPDGRAKGAALYGRLAREAFERRSLTPVKDPPPTAPVVVAARLAALAAGLTDDPAAKALAGLFHLEETGAKVAAKPEDKRAELAGYAKEAEALAQAAATHPAALAYLGAVVFRQASWETDAAKKVVLLKKAKGSLGDAAKSGGEKASPTLIHRDLAIANIALANYDSGLSREKVKDYLEAAAASAQALERAAGDDPRVFDIKGSILEDQAWLATDYTAAERVAFYREAAAGFEKAIAGKLAHAQVRFHAKLHRGRCWYKWANTFPEAVEGKPQEGKDALLRNAEADLIEVRDRGEPEEKVEALYFLAMAELYRAGQKWRPLAVQLYADDLLAARAEPLAAAALAKAEAHLEALAKTTGPGEAYRQRMPEFLACLACNRAIAAGDKTRDAARKTALAALDKLAAAAPLTAAAHRAQFLTGQIEAAVKREAEAAELKVLWAAFQKAVPSPVPEPKTATEEYMLSQLLLGQFKAFALKVPALKLPAAVAAEAKADVPLKELVKLVKAGKIKGANLPTQVEGAAANFAYQSSIAPVDEKPAFAELAALAFEAVAQLDPDHAVLALKPWTPAGGVGWRMSVARELLKDGKNKADLIEKVCQQAEAIAAKQMKPGDAEAEAVAKAVKDVRDELAKK